MSSPVVAMSVLLLILVAAGVVWAAGTLPAGKGGRS
jgi:hypothetical protein